MPEFLDLGRERAGTALLEPRIDPAGRLAQNRKCEAVPVHRRIVLRLIRVEEVPVLDKRKRVRHERGHRGEFAIDALGIIGRIDVAAAAVEQPQSRLSLLVIERVAAEIDELAEPRRRHRLSLDHEMTSAQRLDRGRELRVSETVVIRPAPRKTDLATRSGCEGKRHALGRAREQD